MIGLKKEVLAPTIARRAVLSGNLRANLAPSPYTCFRTPSRRKPCRLHHRPPDRGAGRRGYRPAVQPTDGHRGPPPWRWNGCL